MRSGKRWPKGGVIKVYFNSKEIRLIIKIRNKTQAEIAEKAGISPEQFSRLLAGTCQPSHTTRERLVKEALPGVGWGRLFKIVDTGGSNAL